jgi:A/G-specific adenine glycosylase
MSGEIEPKDFRRRLLSWFGKNKRDLPWRRTREPYAIWVSEIMLQQTRVAAVIEHYTRFMERFPTLTSLADANEEEVLACWSGLGYYRRARLLHRAAQFVAQELGGKLPKKAIELRRLPGIGEYTCAAIASIAFGERAAVVDGNVERVLTRVAGWDENSATEKKIRSMAATLLDQRRPGDFNQAMMELGALVCTPTTPNCPACPLKKHCHAFAHRRQGELPVRAKPANIVAVEEVAVIVRKRGRLLIVQRPDKGRWAGMWEFPHHPLRETDTVGTAALRLLAALGLDGVLAAEVATIRHSVTRFRISMTCILVDHRLGTLNAKTYPDKAWVRVEDLHDYPLSTPQRRLARMLLQKEIDSERQVKWAKREK